MNTCDDCPRCDTCGAPVTTGLMAVFCPRKDCEFMPPEGLPEPFAKWRDEVQLNDLKQEKAR